MEMASWFDIWAEAMALDNFCGKQLKPGISFEGIVIFILPSCHFGNDEMSKLRLMRFGLDVGADDAIKIGLMPATSQPSGSSSPVTSR